MRLPAGRQVPLNKTSLMRKHLLIIGFLLSFNLYSQDAQLFDLIIQSVKIYEPNPSHFNKSNELNQTFQRLLRDSAVNDLYINKKSSELLSDYKEKKYEDDVDTRRIEMRLYMSSCIQALLFDREKFPYALDLARISISDSRGKVHEFLEQEFCGLILLRIFLDQKYNIDIHNDLQDLNSNLKYYKKSLENDFYIKAKHWATKKKG